MENNVGALCLLFGAFMLGLSVGSYHQKSSSPTCQNEFKDPCQQMHGLNTKGIRDYKSKYDRNLKQVVSTCKGK